MKPYKFIPTFIYILFIWILSSGPVEINSFGNFDKVLHLIEYAILGVLLSYGVDLNAKEFPEKIYFILFVGLLFGLLDEIHQYYVPSRTFDIFDIFADVAGIIIGAFLYILFTQILQIVNELKHHLFKCFKDSKP